jgi:CHAT domain-containing protein
MIIHTVIKGALLLLLIWMTGCTTTMSLEEARKTSIATAEKSFTPPPRRIDDILALLEQPGQFDPAITRRFVEETEQKPPEGADNKTLMQFYHRRGEAFRRLGQSHKALDDFGNALDYAEKAGIDNSRLLQHLSHVEWPTGSPQRAIELAEKSLQIKKSLSLYSYLQGLYNMTGDYESALRIRNEGVQFGKHVIALSGDIQKITWAKVHVAGLEAKFLENQAKFKSAEPYWRERLAFFETQKKPHPDALIIARRHLAENLAHQGRFFEAELESRLALREVLGHAGLESNLAVTTIRTLSNILISQGRLDEAEKLTRASITILKNLGVSSDTSQMANGQMILGAILLARGNFNDATAQYDLARDGLKENRLLYEKKFSRSPNLMIALIKAGRVEEGLKLSSQAYALYSKTFRQSRPLTAKMLGIRAMAYAAAGEYQQALADYLRAIPVLTKHVIHDPTNFMEKQRINLIIESFIDLLARIHGTPFEKAYGIDAAAEAFRYVNVLNARSVQTALSSTVARDAAVDPGLAELVRKGQDLELQINVIQSMLTSVMETTSEEQAGKKTEDLNASLENLVNARNVILDEIKKRFPRYGELINPQPATIPVAKGALHPGEALVLIYPSERNTYVWAVPYRGEMRFSVAAMGKKDIEEAVAGLRRALAPNPRTLNDIPPFNLSLAYGLYEKILEPVEGAWKDASSLLIAASGPLGQLPFSVLITQPASLLEEKRELFGNYRNLPWFVRKASVTVLPSVSSLVTLRTLSAVPPPRKAFLGFGDPIFNQDQLDRAEKPKIVSHAGDTVVTTRRIRSADKGLLDSAALNSVRLEQLDRLPDTAEEIKTIAAILNADFQRDAFLGKEASERKVKTMTLSDRKVISFATHALVPGDLDGLDQPALALSSPSVTGEPEDGILTMGEILPLKLNADWVILSACNTGASEGSGAEAVSGLGRAFFYAGTRSLLVSMWPVETTSAKKLVTGIFENQKNNPELSRSHALQKAILDLIDQGHLMDEKSGKIASSYAHPFFWAPFIIVGDPGTSGQ